MKMIMAIVRPEKLQTVKDALKMADVRGLTITHVTGRGSQSGMKFTNRIGEFCVDEIEKMKIETVIEDDRVDEVIGIIRENAVTGEMGDGRIFIIPVERSIKIRTGEE